MITLGNITNIWVSPEILDLEYYASFSSYNDESYHTYKHKVYEDIMRVEYQLRTYPTELDIREKIETLGRIVRECIKIFDDVYKLRKIPGAKEFLQKKRKKKNGGQWEVLKWLNLVKPLMTNDLNYLRNQVTHLQKSSLPNLKECERIVEFVWYFARSLDTFIKKTITEIEYEVEYKRKEDGIFAWFIKTGPSFGWKTGIYSPSFPIEMCRTTRKDNWIEVSLLKPVNQVRYGISFNGQVLSEHKAFVDLYFSSY